MFEKRSPITHKPVSVFPEHSSSLILLHSRSSFAYCFSGHLRTNKGNETCELRTCCYSSQTVTQGLGQCFAITCGVVIIKRWFPST